MPGGVELATAYVSLIPSLQGVGKDTERQLEGEGKKSGNVFAAGMAATVAAGAAAVAAGVAASISQYANYEQLVGGVETLFKGAADTVQANAEAAFQTAGMSANEYMETVTATSAALIRSLGGDTEAAASYADMAIRDMADNANKMGSDIGSLQDAYRGFSRGNFTMLDNLSLGFAGTKEGMEQLLAEAERIQAANGNMVDYSIDSYADMVEAIHVVQTEMGITGTTADEAAGTIQGSLNATSAAWTNLLTHLAEENADIPALLGNLFESASNVVRNIGQRIPIVLTQMMQAVPEAVQSLGDMFAPLVPALLEIAPGLIQSFSDMLILLANQIPIFLPQIVAGGAQLFQGLLLALIQVAPQLIAGLAQALANLAMQIVGNAPAIFTAALQMVGEIWRALLEAAPIIASSLSNIVAQLIAFLAGAAPGLLSAASSFIRGLPQAIGDIIGQAIAAIGEVLNGVMNAITSFDLGSAGIQLMQGLINGIGSMAGAVWDAVTGAVGGAIDGALNLLGIASPSKVFREIGAYTMEGFAIGIEKTANQARLAMLDAASGVVGAAEMTLATSTEGGTTSGVVYNISFNGVQVNDNDAIRAEVDQFVLDMVRRADQ